ncbi:hypothetical protein NQ318_020110 [Aromia moschata]|uniref:PI4-kinase N-terminal domain-containing protein n=1 Tax=Aromia moschata TaxID=1265417 RepID=A0AAV8ZB78_9CUCU|nr:hypothetical protein NQ318_020110 [Aromia moschata]
MPTKVELFTVEAMRTAVDCWQWLVTSRPELEIRFLQEMVSAWNCTVQKRLGLFSVTRPQTSPPGRLRRSVRIPPNFVRDFIKWLYLGANLEPDPPFVKPHGIWVEFICELVETVKYSSYEKVEMLASLIHHSLAMSVGAGAPCQTRHVSAIGVRFRLLSCGLSLLQGDILPKSLAKNVLRERIYCSCLDYFCKPITCPTQNAADLREDITILGRFWQTLHSDKKYLKASDVGDLDLGPTTPISSIQNNELTKPGEYNRSTTGWINTVPLSNSSATLSRRSAKSKRVPMADNFVKCYLKKRNLILELLAVEIEFLIVWHNPANRPELLIPEEVQISVLEGEDDHGQAVARLHFDSPGIYPPFWPSFFPQGTYFKLKYSSFTSVYIVSRRFRVNDAIISEIKTQVQINPTCVSHVRRPAVPRDNGGYFER